ncbi:MAG: VTT domain-containing protein [Synergistaceae bacterium]|jgi:uncharacterized membrane protein YdjX (TVP38/TMEM64 family)|nr:VTT domain-containing protein [Synergistaceae bacterium]
MDMTNSSPFAKAALLVIVLAGAWTLCRLLGCDEYVSGAGVAKLREAAADNRLAASLLYFGGTTLCCVFLALPGVTFAVAAGVIFGPAAGTLLCLAATTAGASLSFLAGRYFLRDAVKPMAERSARLKRLLFDEANKRSAVTLLMITRLLPIFPYNLQNFAYGVTDIGFWRYTVCTFVFMAPGVAFFTFGAAGAAAKFF